MSKNDRVKLEAKYVLLNLLVSVPCPAHLSRESNLWEQVATPTFPLDISLNPHKAAAAWGGGQAESIWYLFITEHSIFIILVDEAVLLQH